MGSYHEYLKVSDDDLTFDHVGRMNYHPDFHPNNGKRYTEEEYEYICKFTNFDGLGSVSFALGRTEKSIATQIQILKKKGKFGYFKRLDKYYV